MALENENIKCLYLLNKFLKQLSIPILVVDDEVDWIFNLKHFLNKKGFNLVSFTDPLLAFEHLKYNHRNYSLILTDLSMPNISGIELANKVRKELNSSIIIFLMTAFDISDLKNKFDIQPAKIERIIQKPLKLSNLLNMINHTLQQQQ